VIQPDKYKPLSLDPVVLKPIRFKRALIDFEAVIGGIKSRLKGILEFRGRSLTITDREGQGARNVALALATDFFFRYRQDGLNLAGVLKEGSICEGSVANSDEFLGYLHFIKNKGGLDVSGEMLDGFALHKRREFDNFTTKLFE
jgi:hypothetical protein